MIQIESLHAREILDSRGNPTVEVDIGSVMGQKPELPSLPVHRRGKTKPVSLETKMQNATAAKG